MTTKQETFKETFNAGFKAAGVSSGGVGLTPSDIENNIKVAYQHWLDEGGQHLIDSVTPEPSKPK